MSTLTGITDRTVKGAIVRDGDLSAMTADGALEKFDVVYVTSAGKVKKHPGTATINGIGIVPRAYADGATDVDVLLFNRGRILEMRAASAVGIGVTLMAVADGEVDDWVVTADAANAADAARLGVAMTAATNANDYIEVLCL